MILPRIRRIVGFAAYIGTISVLLNLSGCSTTSQSTGHKTAQAPIQKDLLTVNPAYYAQAYHTYYAKAHAGDPIAQNNLAQMYAEGRGVKQDPVKAMYWYNKAAAQGFAPAEVNLGVAYLYGMGVAKDTTTACELFNKATKHQNRDGYDFYQENCKIA